MSRYRWVDPRHVTPIHAIRKSREHHLRELLDRMRRDGWEGRPLIVEETAPHRYQAWTGTHRREAAQRVHIRVPIVLIDKDKWIRRWGHPKGRLFVDDVDDDMDKYIALHLAGDLLPARIMHQEIELNMSGDSQKCRNGSLHTCL
jgi:hypothetical protein